MQKPQEIYDNLVKKFQESGQTVQDSLNRGRRSVKTEVDNFDKHVSDNNIDDIYVNESLRFRTDPYQDSDFY